MFLPSDKGPCRMSSIFLNMRSSSSYCIYKVRSAILKLISCTLSRSLTVLSFLKILIFNWGELRQADNILIYQDGGFGHTLSGPDWMRRLYPGQVNLTLFATTTRHHHNPVIAEIWGAGRFLWVRCGLTLPRLGLLVDIEFQYRIMKALHGLLQRLFPGKQVILGWEDLMNRTPRPSWVKSGGLADSRYEVRYFAEIQKVPQPGLHLDQARLRAVEQALCNVVGNVPDRRCCFYLRNKSSNVEASANARCSQGFSVYAPAIRYLVKKGFLVLVTGDLDIDLEQFPVGVPVVDGRGLGVDRNLYQVYAGTQADFHIGNFSGGSAYVYTNAMPNLMLDSLAIGEASPFSTVHYKKIYTPEGRRVPMDVLFRELFFDYECRGYNVVNHSADEILEAVADMVENGLHTSAPYGISPDVLGIDAPWFKSANARLSPVWVNQFSNDLGLPPDVSLKGH